MHGLPGQSVQQALDDVQAVIELRPPHISWYQLTLEPNTVFFARPPQDLPAEDTAYEIQEQGAHLLADAGYAQYEVSAFARDGEACQHNLNYWLFGDYLAAGAGAHGKLTTQGGICRYRKPANPQQYMNAMEAGGADFALSPVPGNELLFEFMLNALRLSDGFDETLFVERTGLNSRQLEEAMQPALEKGLVARDAESRWRPTDLGRRFLNALQASFLPGGG